MAEKNEETEKSRRCWKISSNHLEKRAGKSAGNRREIEKLNVGRAWGRETLGIGSGFVD